MSAYVARRTIPTWGQVKCPSCSHFLRSGDGNESETTCAHCGVTYEYES